MKILIFGLLCIIISHIHAFGKYTTYFFNIRFHRATRLFTVFENLKEFLKRSKIKVQHYQQKVFVLSCRKSIFFLIVLTQVRISVNCQSWTIGPRLALLWRSRFGDHSWANCGSFGFTNFGSQRRQQNMCPTVGSTMAQTRTDCRVNFGELI